MTQFGLVGGVLGHSLSALIHKKLFEIKKRAGEYNHYETSCLDKTYKEILSKLDGFNITIPYKQDIMKYLDWADENVKRFNACNFAVDKEGKKYGYNTDVDGFLYTLKSKNVELKGKNVLVTGAGGVSHMLAATSLIEGANVTLFARNEDKAKALCDFCKHSTGKSIQMYNGENNFDILLQGTPAGMYPNYFDCSVPLSWLKNIPFVFDTIYNPVKTLAISVSEYYGNECAGGLSMLVSQAVKAHEIYFGDEFSQTDIKDTESICVPFLTRISGDYNIILTGAPGSGKTTIGKELSGLLNFEFVDLDNEIEKLEKRRIKDIFATDGEDYFRAKETEVFKESLKNKGCIISTGGGIIERNKLLSQRGKKDIIVYINTPFSVIAKRIENDISRPLLAENAVEKLRILMNKRENLYKNDCDIEIIADGTVKDVTVSVIDEIINYINQRELTA